MKIKKILLITALTIFAFNLQAQDEEEASDLSISGSVDTYYRYDFAGEASKGENIDYFTYFGSDQNSFSIGMVNLILEKSVGKVSFVGDVSFGPRGQSQSIVDGNGGTGSFHIQNLYATYAFTDQFSVSAGFMGTFVGYEVISPTGNFNYSTSYLFSWGPFQNAGIKFTYAPSDRFSLMAGVFNDWNQYTDPNKKKDFGAQLYVAPVDGWDVYVNFITGDPSGTEIDLTTGYQVTDEFHLGLNAANYDASEGDGGFNGAALYAQYAFTDGFSLGLRGEVFKDKNGGILEYTGETSVTAFTLSANIKSGPLTIIPEFRVDSGKDEIFVDNDRMAAKAASQLLVAAVFAF